MQLVPWNSYMLQITFRENFTEKKGPTTGGENTLPAKFVILTFKLLCGYSEAVALQGFEGPRCIQLVPWILPITLRESFTEKEGPKGWWDQLGQEYM